jgi:hypothetical protein
VTKQLAPIRDLLLSALACGFLLVLLSFVIPVVMSSQPSAIPGDVGDPEVPTGQR